MGRENEVTATGNQSRRREVESQGEKFWNIWWSVELRGRTERGLETRAGGREGGEAEEQTVTLILSVTV